MAEDLFLHGLQYIGSLMNVIIIPLATIIVGRKLLKEKKATGKLNDIRASTFFIFFSFSFLVILEFLIRMEVYDTPHLANFYGGNYNGFNIYSLVIGLIASMSITIVTLANRWDFLQYTSLFFYGGMILLYVFTGFDALLEPYIYFAGGGSIIFLYFTAFRVKDNGALAMAIFFTLAFGTVILDIALLTGISVIIYNVVILIFSFGWFKPFKQEVSI
ncbi:MAG: hypothetical protein HWN79_18655 [Candidatus Lokiarchaeota archaeon]|nr:hypothetical protein [Candidatus Lokiarchaeota archaeon]